MRSSRDEDTPRKNDVPIIGPAVARMLTLFVQGFLRKRFLRWVAIGYSTFLRAAGQRQK